MNWSETKIPVADSKHFETLNGLWTGKKEPFVEAGVIRNTNFTPSGVIDFSNVAYLLVERKQLSKRRLEAGDIILERSGGGPKQAAMQATLNAILSELQKPAPPSTLLSEIAGLLRDLLSKLDNWRGPLSTK